MFATGVINVHAVSRRKESTYMKTFTIDTDNNITVHASRKAARETGVGVFASEEQLAELIGPDNKRLVEIWNGLPGVKPVTKFANRKVGDRAHLEGDSEPGRTRPQRLVPETPFDAPGAPKSQPAELPRSRARSSAERGTAVERPRKTPRCRPKSSRPR